MIWHDHITPSRLRWDGFNSALPRSFVPFELAFCNDIWWESIKEPIEIKSTPIFGATGSTLIKFCTFCGRQISHVNASPHAIIHVQKLTNDLFSFTWTMFTELLGGQPASTDRLHVDIYNKSRSNKSYTQAPLISTLNQRIKRLDRFDFLVFHGFLLGGCLPYGYARWHLANLKGQSCCEKQRRQGSQTE